MIYLIIILTLFFLSYRYDYCLEIRGKKAWIIIMWVIFVLLAGLRYRIGMDTLMYIDHYKDIKPITQLTAQDFENIRFAPGFIILFSLFRQFTDDLTAFQLLHSTFVCSAVFVFLKRRARHFFFSLIIFFIFQYTLLLYEQMRESMAVAVMLFAWPWFEKGKWLKWYIACVVALMFHISSMVLIILPIVTIPGVRQLFVLGYRTWIICIIVFLLGIIIQNAFFKYIQLLEIADAVSERAQAYSTSKLSGNTLNIMGIFNYVFLYVLYPLLSLYFINKINLKTNNKINVENERDDAMALMSVYVSLLSVSMSILTRFNNYFFIFAVVNMSNFAFTYIPWFGKLIRFKYIYWVMLFLPLFALNIYSSYLRDLNKSGTLKSYMSYYPYSSYFDQTMNKDREACIRYTRRKLR